MEENPGLKSGSPSSGSSPKREENILKRGTRVKIMGNVRTKPELVGLEGTVKACNGLGGWHEIGTANFRGERLAPAMCTVFCDMAIQSIDSKIVPVVICIDVSFYI